jgi:uncharacterized membrane protein
MEKREYLDTLRKNLNGMPEKDMEHALSYYSEMIDDRIEDGMSESEAVADIASPEEAAAETLRAIPLHKLVIAKVKPKRALRVWEIVLLVLGSPIWVSLLIAVAAVVFSIYAVLWSLIAVLYALEISFAAVGVACTVLCFCYLASPYHSGIAEAMAVLGMGLVSLGLVLPMHIASVKASKGMAWLGKRILLLIKRVFVGKRG